MTAAEGAIFSADKTVNKSDVDKSVMEGKIDMWCDLIEKAKDRLAKVENELHYTHMQ